MGKPVKLSDREKAWFRPRKTAARRYREREQRQQILIVYEGEKTEPNYFEAIKRRLPRHVVELHVEGVGANTLSLVRRAQELRSQYSHMDPPLDQVWVVFDRDSFPPDDFDNAIHMAEADKIACAWSNEAFELWYLLHFEDRQTPMARSDYAARLGTYLGEPYRKNAEDMYDQLAKKGDQNMATRRATRLCQSHTERPIPPSQANPGTTVHRLVQELNKFEVRR